jgi:hypothetical protein
MTGEPDTRLADAPVWEKLPSEPQQVPGWHLVRHREPRCEWERDPLGNEPSWWDVPTEGKRHRGRRSEWDSLDISGPFEWLLVIGAFAVKAAFSLAVVVLTILFWLSLTIPIFLVTFFVSAFVGVLSMTSSYKEGS